MKELVKQWKDLSMLNLLMICVVLLTTSCKAPETNVERCLISIEHQTCFCHKYEINKDYIGRIGKTYEKEYEYCDKLVGFTAHNWWELRDYLGRVQRAFKAE